MCSCTPQTLRQAQQVVVAADSLWTNGQMFRDSVQLAQAYESLGKWQILYADEYAHACYHYGRLLRELNDPVSAMQAFIDATHSHTRDYHILGRVYSNMGSICHLASEFPLSYDMYEKSADLFLKNDDTLLYYYGLNNMALELAELGKKDSTLALLSLIRQHDYNKPLITKTYETQAEMYMKIQQYDSALYYANLFCVQEKNNSTGLLIKAQTFCLLHEQDSATYYSNLVIEKSESLYAIHNALYILTNDDTTKDIDDVRKTASDRSDVQKQLRIYQGKLSQAIQLLEQDINRKTDLKWLWSFLLTILVIGTILSINITMKRKRHQLLSQQIQELEAKNSDTIEQKRLLVELNCARFAESKDYKRDICWNDYSKMCDIVDQFFYLLVKKLQLNYSLSEREIRLCVLSLFDFGYDRVAELLFYAPNGVGKLKVRVAKKLGTTAKNLRQFLIEMAIKN